MNTPQNQANCDLQKYSLVDTSLPAGAPGQTLQSGIVLSRSEAQSLNYALALNGTTRKYVQEITAEGTSSTQGGCLILG